MLPTPCILRKEELVFLIKGSRKTEFFSSFLVQKENIQRKAKMADLSNTGLA